MLRLLLVIVLLLAPSAWAADVCTFGTDCFCACVSGADRGDGYVNDGCADDGIKVKPSGSTVVICDDFENPDYDSDINSTATSDSWVDGSGFSPVCRGCNNAWVDKWSFGAQNQLWQAGEPGSPAIGPNCDSSYTFGCGPMEWTLSNVFEANSFQPGIDIQKTGQVDDDVSGLTISTNYDGAYYLGGRVPAGQCADIAGTKSFSGGSQAWFTGRLGYSTNIVTAGVHVDDGFTCNTNADFVPRPWKHPEWGSSVSFWFMGNSSSNPFGSTSKAPFAPYISRNTGASEAACDSAIDAAMTVGQGECDANFIYVAPGASYDRSDDFALGKLALIRGYVNGLGTSSCEYHVWAWHEDWGAEIEMMAWSGLACSTYVLDSSISPLAFNWFYNGGKTTCETTGPCQTTQPIYVYWDNFLVGTGSAPPSAADLGWGVGGDGGTAPPGSEPTRIRGTFRGTLADTDERLDWWAAQAELR